MKDLTNCRVAILAADGFEKSELFEPKKALEKEGATCLIISLKSGEIKAWEKGNWAGSIDVDQVVSNTNPEDFDALLLPGGVMNPDKLRNDEAAVEFVRSFVMTGKPIASICHGPQTLINAYAVKGRKMTSYPSIRVDLENAGAEWEDSEVVVDDGLVTSRKPEDIPAFNKEMISLFKEGSQYLRVPPSNDQPTRSFQ
jgi:protease I